MSYQLWPIPFIVIGTVITWRARNKEQYGTVAIFQPVTTTLTIVVAVLSLMTPGASAGFTGWILAGLVLSLAGDVFNINMSKDSILYPALIVFVFAYLTYPIGVTIYNGFHPQDLSVAAAGLVVWIGMVAFIWRGLGKGWGIPAIIYTGVMIFMVTRSVSMYFGTAFSLTQATLMTTGTSLLLIADFEYSIHRFLRPFKTIMGPLMYPTGQLLIALSPSYFHSV
jgi:uncharacterized membrane protein YhhN